MGIHKQLLISLVQPYHGVTSSTISRWVVNMLDLCGIDTKIFKTHSARSASTSKASSVGISLSEIVKRGRRKSDSTFRKFYLKNIKDTLTFQEGILSSIKRL